MIKKIMASENITLKEAKAVVNNTSYAKIIVNNKFDL